MKALAVKAESRFQSITEFREGITPQEVEPATSPASKFIFLPIFAVLATLIFVSANSPAMWGILPLSQVLLFGATLALLFWMWKAIQDGHTRISPELAAGLTLIPGFNLCWIFP